jgi:hypothetical protein
MTDKNDNETTGASGVASSACSRPRRRFKVEIVGYGDSYLEAMDSIDRNLEEAYADPPEKCRIGPDGWVSVDKKEDALTGDQYLEQVREYRKRKRSENNKDYRVESEE